MAAGFLLITVGSYGWVKSSQDYERMLAITSERLFTSELINEYGSRSALRIGEQMSPAEQQQYRDRARQTILADESQPIHANFKADRRRSVLQLVVGIAVTLVAGRVYYKIVRPKTLAITQRQRR